MWSLGLILHFWIMIWNLLNFLKIKRFHYLIAIRLNCVFDWFILHWWWLCLVCIRLVLLSWIFFPSCHLMFITGNVFDTIRNIFERLIFELSVLVTVIWTLVYFLKVTISLCLKIKWILMLFIRFIDQESVGYWCLRLSNIWWFFLGASNDLGS